MEEYPILHKPKLLVIIGNTAAGKTEFAHQIVAGSNAQIVNLDASLVYRQLSIATNKPSNNELKEFNYHLVNIADFWQQFSVGKYMKIATSLLDKLTYENQPLILVGGSMLYLQSLLGYIDLGVETNNTFRDEFQNKLQNQGIESLYSELKRRSAKRASQINPNDVKRIERALEITESTVTSQPKSVVLTDKYEVYVYAVTLQRAQLHKNIEYRIDAMFANGLLKEVESLVAHPKFLPSHSSLAAIGYKQTIDYIQGNCTFKDARTRMLIATRKLVRSQNNWMHKLKIDSMINGDNLKPFVAHAKSLLQL